jgi:hypothetical protein
MKKPKSSPAPAPTLVTVRMPPEPGSDAFLAATDSWIDELRRDFRRSTGFAFDGGNGILFAHDVLVELHGREASWSRFDVHVFERWIRTNAPGFEAFLPTMLSELMCLTNLLARRGQVAPEIAEATAARTFELIGRKHAPAGSTRH